MNTFFRKISRMYLKKQKQPNKNNLPTTNPQINLKRKDISLTIRIYQNNPPIFHAKKPQSLNKAYKQKITRQKKKMEKNFKNFNTNRRNSKKRV